MVRFRSHANQNQIDPFNAGEPEMPWNDPSALHDDACSVPAKGEGYEPPHNNQVEPQQSILAEQLANSPVEQPITTAAEPQRETFAEAQGQQMTFTSAKPAERPKRLLSRIIGWIVIAVVTVTIIGVIVDLVGDLFDDFQETPDNPFIESSENTYSDDESYTTEENSAALEVVNSYLADVQSGNNTAVNDRLNRGLNDSVANWLAYRLDDLGIDAQSYYDAAQASLTFTEVEAYAYSNGEGTVFAQASVLSNYSFALDFYDNVQEYLQKEGASDVSSLSNDQKSHLQAIFDDTAEGFSETDTSYLSFKLAKDAGTWAIDEESFMEEMDYLFNCD